MQKINNLSRSYVIYHALISCIMLKEFIIRIILISKYSRQQILLIWDTETWSATREQSK